MLKRLYLLVAGIWAALTLIPEMLSDRGEINGKVLLIAFTPFALGWLIARGGRYVVTGSPLKPEPRSPMVRRDR